MGFQNLWNPFYIQHVLFLFRLSSSPASFLRRRNTDEKWWMKMCSNWNEVLRALLETSFSFPQHSSLNFDTMEVGRHLTSRTQSALQIQKYLRTQISLHTQRNFRTVVYGFSCHPYLHFNSNFSTTGCRGNPSLLMACENNFKCKFFLIIQLQMWLSYFAYHRKTFSSTIAAANFFIFCNCQ